jgi:RND superfamily putative drug exporter
MLVMQVPFVSALAIGSSLAVATTLLAALTVAPALLGFSRGRAALPTRRTVLYVVLADLAVFGFVTHVPALSVCALGSILGLMMFTRRSLWFSKKVAVGGNSPRSGRRFESWALLVQRHPARAFCAGVALLLVLTAPVFSMRLGTTDSGNLPRTETARRAYDAIRDAFGPGANGPLLLLGDASTGSALNAASRLSSTLMETEGVSYVSPPTYLPGTRYVVWQVLPETGPQDAATSELIAHLRTDVLPAAGLQVLVTGETASFDDFGNYLGARLTAFMLTVLGMSFLLLLLVFRSVLVPLKAVILNLLSISASYGIVTAVFQWGWGADLLNIGAPGPIEPVAPMMLFAIVFGLSMDYEVFLLSRMRESFNKTGDNTGAVTAGLVHTARVITAAAAIMVAVFGSFVLEDYRQVKLFGVGLAMAVLLDATVVRMLLVPASMEMLGSRNWWMPRWLERVLPRVELESPQEGHPLAANPAEPTAKDG